MNEALIAMRARHVDDHVSMLGGRRAAAAAAAVLSALIVCVAAAGSPAGEASRGEEGVDGERRSILSALLADVAAVRADAAARTRIEWDSEPRQRWEKEIKDRYEALFEQVVRPHKQASFLAEGLADDASPLAKMLWPRYAAVRIATHAGWRRQIEAASARYPLSWSDATAFLQREHQAVLALPRLPPALLDEAAADAAPPSSWSIAALLNASHLPTHAEIGEAVAWLHPSYTPGPFDARVASRPVVGAPLDGLLTPADWVYTFSNRAFRQCEVLTVEYIDALARYLATRLTDGDVVLEVGAGNGRLTHFVRRAFEALAPRAAANVRWVATDAFGRVDDAFAHFEVETLSTAAAVERYAPRLVLCSWMSLGEDWTPAMRAAPSVAEYVLIGEVDYGVSGKAWSTWGVSEGEHRRQQQQAPFERDGFERVDLHHLSVLQIARSDTPHVRFHSRTTSFRRRAPHAASRTEL